MPVSSTATVIVEPALRLDVPGPLEVDASAGSTASARRAGRSARTSCATRYAACAYSTSALLRLSAARDRLRIVRRIDPHDVEVGVRGPRGHRWRRVATTARTAANRAPLADAPREFHDDAAGRVRMRRHSQPTRSPRIAARRRVLVSPAPCISSDAKAGVHREHATFDADRPTILDDRCWPRCACAASAGRDEHESTHNGRVAKTRMRCILAWRRLHAGLGAIRLSLAATLFSQSLERARRPRRCRAGRRSCSSACTSIHEVTSPQAFDMLRQHGWARRLSRAHVRHRRSHRADQRRRRGRSST